MFKWWKKLTITKKTGIVFAIFGFFSIFILWLMKYLEYDLREHSLFLLPITIWAFILCGWEGPGILSQTICYNSPITWLIYSLINSIQFLIFGIIIGFIIKKIGEAIHKR